MVMATQCYRRTNVDSAQANLNWTGATPMRSALMLDSHTPGPNTDDFMADAAAGRAAVGGDSTSAADIAVTPAALDTAVAGETRLPLAESSITYLSVDTGQSVGGIILYQLVTNDADSPLRSSHVFAGGAFDPLGGDVEVSFPATGVLVFTNGILSLPN